jgi:hypothetical protein
MAAALVVLVAGRGSGGTNTSGTVTTQLSLHAFVRPSDAAGMPYALLLDTDRCGRAIGEVILPDRRTLNRGLVRTGLAW